jgi:uncharacterized protein DUF937
MTGSLLERLHGLVTPDLLSSAARKLDEPESLVAAGLRAAFPALLAGLGSKAQNARSLRALHQLITESGSAAEVLKHPRLAVAATPDSPLGAAGGRLLTRLFGPHLPTVADLVARSAGLRAGSGEPLVELAAPLVLGLLVHRVRSDALGPAGLAAMLLGEHDRIARTLPPGLKATPDSTGPPPPVFRWLSPMIALGMLLLLLWGLSRDQRPAVVDRTIGTINAIMAGNH